MRPTAFAVPRHVSLSGRRPGDPKGGVDLLWLAVIAAAAMAATAHVRIGLGAPLWFDESWTGALAWIDDPRQLVHQMREEAGGPLYYGLAWSWARVFGVSNASLHSLSLLLSLLAPLLAWAGLRTAHPRLALAWAILLAIWGPGLAQSGYARCYPLLTCVAIATTVAFVHCLDRPTLRRTCAWALLGSLTILTHYDAGLLVAVQGICFVARHRRAALATWPAALLFVPTAAWIALNVHRLAAMATPGVTWYHLVTLDGLPFVAAYLVGASLKATLLAGPLALICHILLRSRDDDGGSTASAPSPAAPVAPAASPQARTPTSAGPDPGRGFRGRSPSGITLAWVANAIAVVVLVILAMIRPIFTPRYLIAFEPGFALMVAVWLVGLCRGSRNTLGALLGLCIAFSALYWTGPLPLPERLMNFEVASQWIADSSPSRLVFFWDNPTAATAAEDQMDLVGGFFLRRGGLEPQVETVYPRVGSDMNASLVNKVGRTGSLIWIYDPWVDLTTATEHPPVPAQFDKAVECRDFGRFGIGIFACRPRHAEAATGGS